MPSRKQKRKSPLTLLELVLILSIGALATATILPSIRLTREAIAIERAARCLEKTETAIGFILKTNTTVTNRQSISLAMIDEAFANTNLSSRISAPVWPPEAILDSFDPEGSGGPTIDVRLKDGETKVSADDIATPRAPRQQNTAQAVRTLL